MSRNRKGNDKLDHLEGKKIIVKYAEGDFHGKIVRKITSNKFIILWEGDSAEDVNPITLDPRKMGKQFKADQNGWEIVEEEPEPPKEKEPVAPPPSIPSPVTTSGKRTTNPVKRSLSEGGVKIKLTGTFSESPTKVVAPPAPAAKKPKPSPPLSLHEQLEYIKLKLGLLKGVEMNPALSEGEVKQFEEKEGISLPTEYRQFLLTVGNGGAGPVPDGLCKLGDQPKAIDGDAPESSLAKPWQLRATDMSAAAECYLGYQSCYTKTAVEADSREISVAEKQLAQKSTGKDGLLWLGPGREDSNHYLTVNGDGKGEIWLIAPDYFGPYAGGFMEWYLSWLDQQPISVNALSSA